MADEMKSISIIWFDGDWLYGLGDDGKIYRQALLWYARLRTATDEQRARYEISTIGIHWPDLDEDVSFESFLYPDADPSRLQRFFQTHPEINVSGFARRYGFSASLLRSYINGIKTPSAAREQEIMNCIEKLGKEYLAIAGRRSDH